MWGRANFLFWGALGAILWPTVDTIAPAIEGKLYPVVHPAIIKEIVPTGQIVSVVRGESVKLRSCNFVSINWFLGRPGQPSSRVSVDFLDGTKVRASGEFDWGPWRVAIPADLLATGSYAVVVHRCHPLWETESLFWAPVAFSS
ncbi:hypothetical protein Pam3_30 [Pseudanabaena phage Pam3]|nr:hypothetical protein Pam3_30 [Pseudanabaena phage Pam3]